MTSVRFNIVFTLQCITHRNQRYCTCITISQSNFASKEKPKKQDVMRNPFQAKNINDSMFIEDLSKWHQ